MCEISVYAEMNALLAEADSCRTNMSWLPHPHVIPNHVEITRRDNALRRLNVLTEFLYNHSLYPVQNFAGERFIIPSALR